MPASAARRTPMRVRWHLHIGFALIFASALHGAAERASSQEKNVLDAAKKEGQVTIFGSIQDDVMRSIQSSFEKRYPGIKSIYWRASTTAVMDRAISEF